jgi:A/G-specific adenine glycosylase
MMELGAMVCTPKSPTCLMCPVREFCATRGEHVTAAAPARMKREVAYALVQRRGKVALVQRAAAERLMPGMWELPSTHANGEPQLLTVKHAITVTDYTVRVFAAGPAEVGSAAKWFGADELVQLPLTGLTRKVLKRAGIIE